VVATREYRLTGNLDARGRRDLLRDRLVDYRAHVTQCSEDALSKTIDTLLTSHGSHSVAVPADLPAHWTTNVSIDLHYDAPILSVHDLDGIESTISGCAVVVAQTGTIILDSGVHQGRRALSLVPDHLIVVIFDDQIVEVLPEAIARLAANSTQTWISGPSATSDIELERIEGVHGPRTLDVVVVVAD
jgi:L-lactate dehydrogenase complex protein LldG